MKDNVIYLNKKQKINRYLVTKLQELIIYITMNEDYIYDDDINLLNFFVNFINANINGTQLNNRNIALFLNNINKFDYLPGIKVKMIMIYAYITKIFEDKLLETDFDIQNSICYALTATTINESEYSNYVKAFLNESIISLLKNINNDPKCYNEYFIKLILETDSLAKNSDLVSILKNIICTNNYLNSFAGRLLTDDGAFSSLHQIILDKMMMIISEGQVFYDPKSFLILDFLKIMEFLDPKDQEDLYMKLLFIDNEPKTILNKIDEFLEEIETYKEKYAKKRVLKVDFRKNI